MIQNEEKLLTKIGLEEKEIRLQQVKLLEEIAKRLLCFSDWNSFNKWSSLLIEQYENEIKLYKRDV